MKIFKPKTVQVFPENPKSPDFITNVTLNSATETLKDFNKMCFLPAGSWMTGIDYDPQLSDHDLTILLPNNGPYHKMEADVFDARKCMKENILKRLETHKIPEETIHQKIIPSINIFPTPQIQHCFDSYDQFIKFTNLKISLDDKVDPDKGLWQMKNLVVNHFENEGKLLYLKKDGSLRLMPIKQNKKNFYNYLKQNNIYMPEDSTLYFSHKLKIVNEFIDVLQKNTELPTRSFYKYLTRIKKFFFQNAENDLFLIGNDPRKINNPKFQERLKLEKQFQNLYNSISNRLKELNISRGTVLPEQYTKETLNNLKLFKELAENILNAPLLKGFKGK